MLTKDNRDLPILEITPENYKVPAGEERFYHVKMEVKNFSQRTGERLSHPYIQKFAAIDFENGMMSSLRQQGYDMVILHNPREWAKEHAEEIAKAKAQKKADAAAKAEADKKALKEEILAEIAAEEKKKKENKGKKKEDSPAEEPDLS